MKRKVAIVCSVLCLFSMIFAQNTSAAETSEGEQRQASITIQPDRYTAKVGETVKFTVHVVNADSEQEENIRSNLIWESSDPDIATVEEDGIMYAVSPGFVGITAKYAYDDEIMAGYTIRVDGDIDNFSINVTSKTMVIGETLQITPTFYMNGEETITDLPEITWTSSDLDVATVSSSGLVTAMGPGKAMIQAQVLSLGKVEVCTITISKQPALRIKKISQNRMGIKIQWNRKASAEGYLLERKVEKGKWTSLFDGDDRVSYEDENVKEGKKYQYRLSYYTNYDGELILSKKSTKSIYYYGGKPEKPIITESKKTSSGYRLTWSGISDADYVQIFGKKGAGKWQPIRVNGKDFSAKTTDYVSIGRGFFPSGTYYMKVRTYRVVKGKKYYSPYSETIVIRY